MKTSSWLGNDVWLNRLYRSQALESFRNHVRCHLSHQSIVQIFVSFFRTIVVSVSIITKRGAQWEFQYFGPLIFLRASYRLQHAILYRQLLPCPCHGLQSPSGRVDELCLHFPQWRLPTFVQQPRPPPQYLDVKWRLLSTSFKYHPKRNVCIHS